MVYAPFDDKCPVCHADNTPFMTYREECEKLRAENTTLRTENEGLRKAVRAADCAIAARLKYVEEPPERNCSCHLSPPCSDCVDYSALREFFGAARAAATAIAATKQATTSAAPETV